MSESEQSNKTSCSSPEERYNDPECSEKIKDEIFFLEFSINRSLIYFAKRKSFFDSLHHMSVISATLSSSVAFAALFANYQSLTKIMMFLVIMISMIDISVGFSKKNDMYDSLQRRFTALLINILSKEHTESNLIQWRIERLLIEQDEPPVLNVLNIICHNEQCIAQGYDDQIRKIPRFKLLLRHLWSFDNWNPNK